MAKKKPSGQKPKKRVASKDSASKDRASSPGKRRAASSPSNVEHAAERAAERAQGDGDVSGEKHPLPPYPVVGIGASAGGLEACSELLEALPEGVKFPIIVVQHLSPERKSDLPELLGRRTSIPVIEVEEEMAIEPGRIYIIPPNVQLEVKEGHFHLSPRPTEQPQPMPIDVFFRSLARYADEQAVGVVLSGSNTDGAMGLRDIKASGGITLAQTPETAKFDGMPRAAIAAEAVDLVRSPGQIARELVAISGHRDTDPARPAATDGSNIEESQLARIFLLLRAASGVDFNHYKPPTIRRRLMRRMTLRKIATLDEYLKFLQQTPAEVQELYRDILIHVTRFFREPDSFDTLKQLVYPKLLEDRRSDQPIRVWIPGCSTGEESYSVAITLLEFLQEQGASCPVQVFATDVGETAIERARAGVYPENIAEDVSPERLNRFFTRIDGSYQISKAVRSLCIFARQDLTRDPPFSRLDLIVCRNVLIYLAPPTQKKLMHIFHYVLRPTGFLMLGAAESVGPHSDLFSVADKRDRVYLKKVADHVPEFHFPLEYAPRPHTPPALREESQQGTIEDEASRVVLERFGPPGVVVTPNLQIVQFRGQTGKYLQPAAGEATFSLVRMAREGLLVGLRTAVRDAKRTGKPARSEGLQVKTNGGFESVDLEVIPFGGPGEDHYFLVLFCESAAPVAEAPPAKRKSKQPRSGPREAAVRVAILERELSANREHLQAIIQDLEAANEELQSANEEILSSNEELQSTNEELDTAKEELQSTNEELNTVNAELHSRNDELRRINSDLVNLLATVEIAILMVDGKLRIRRFTPMAERLLNLISSDVGRPIQHIKSNIGSPDLESLIAEATSKGQMVDREVQDDQGNSYSLRIRPYRDAENRVDGAVIPIFDILARRPVSGR